MITREQVLKAKKSVKVTDTICVVCGLWLQPGECLSASEIQLVPDFMVDAIPAVGACPECLSACVSYDRSDVDPGADVDRLRSGIHGNKESAISHNRMAVSGKKVTQRRDINTWFVNHGPDTQGHCAEALGIQVQSCSTRVSELKKLGLLYGPVGRKETPSNGTGGVCVAVVSQ